MYDINSVEKTDSSSKILFLYKHNFDYTPCMPSVKALLRVLFLLCGIAKTVSSSTVLRQAVGSSTTEHKSSVFPQG
jgi:hypothetical protein